MEYLPHYKGIYVLICIEYYLQKYNKLIKKHVFLLLGQTYQVSIKKYCNFFKSLENSSSEKKR